MFRRIVFELLGVDPDDADRRIVGDAGVHDGFVDRFVSIL